MGITDKKRFLSNLDNDRIIKFAHIYDLAQKAERYSSTVYGDFVSEETAAELLKRSVHLPAFPSFYGGFDSAQRKMVAFLSEYDEPCYPLSLLRVTSSHLKSLTHRDFLGSIMALGIKREKCGDIIITDDCAQIILSDDVISFVSSSLEKVGRVGVKTAVAPLSSLCVPQKTFTPVSGTVSSLRLDCVVSLFVGKGRAKASELIGAGLVFVNSLPALKADMRLFGGEVISVRGKGKASLEIGGNSKKGRIFVTLNIFS